MAYSQNNSKGVTYYLHEFDAELKGGRVYRRHFFGKAINPKGTPIDAVPDGHIVVENARTGLLVLKRAAATAPAVSEEPETEVAPPVTAAAAA